MELILLAGIGIILGISAAIPGVSLGTMAVSFNVYDRLIEVITPNIKKILQSWKFWLPLLAGIGAGIILFSKLANFLFDNYPVPTYWFFIGLITGSIPLVYSKVKHDSVKVLPSISSIICIVIALSLIIIFALLSPPEKTAETNLTLSLIVLLLLGGVLSALAMIVPGISGSFMLLVIGLYRTVIQAVSDFNVSILLLVAVGVVIGLFAGAAGIRLLLAKVPRETYSAVFGLVLGSIFILLYKYDSIPSPSSENFIAILIFLVLAFVAGFSLSFFTGKKNIL